MLEKLFQKIIKGGSGKPFSAWQVELTTRCPLRCKMCIRAESADWQFQDMPFENFKKILPFLKDVEAVVLEGWGESLFYKNLEECIRLVKKEGSQVGFVTSGKGLTRTRALNFIEAGLDFVGFSIAGTTVDTHDAIRINSHLIEIFSAIQLFNEEKKRQKVDRPRIHLVLLMLKDNIFEVPQVPSLASEIGIDEVVLTNICHTINAWQEKQRVFVWGNEKNEYERFVKEAEMNAGKLNIRLKRPSLYAGNVSICNENPLRNLYVSVEGEVSPCVYLHPPLPSPFKRIFCSEPRWQDKVSFGNIFKEPISEIWNREDYVRFRDRFIQRDKKFMDSYYSLWNGKMADHLNERDFPPPPNPCKTCHKMLGI